jgi:hypothetical protein
MIPLSFFFLRPPPPWCAGWRQPPGMAGRLAPGGEPQCGGRAPHTVSDDEAAVHGRKAVEEARSGGSRRVNQG